MDALKQENYKDYNIKIYQDDHAESPREDDNLGVMVCGHNKYEKRNI